MLTDEVSMPTPVLKRLPVEDLRALVQGVLAFERAMSELAEDHSVTT